MQEDWMDSTLLVSIIINNHNYGRFLPCAVDSALGQTYGRVEVVVVDDGSTDNSRAVIEGYGNKIVPILKSRGGQGSAMNAGFACSHGDAVIFLDADDVLAPETAGRVAVAFRKHPTTAKLQFRMAVIDEYGKPTGEIKPPTYKPVNSGDLRRSTVTFPFDLNWMATSGNAFPASVLRRILPMPEADFRILADFYLSHLTSLFGPVLSLTEVGSYYRVHDSNYYESANTAVDLKRIRTAVSCMQATNRSIANMAGELGLTAAAPSRDILSVSYVGYRLILRKLDPRHTRRSDSLARLLYEGILASIRRFDVPPAKRLIFGLWFLAMVLVPRRIARWLAGQFFFPQSRGTLGRALRLPGRPAK